MLITPVGLLAFERRKLTAQTMASGCESRPDG
jgi:hypothetical protein